MRNRYDQAGKRIIHKALEAEGTFASEVEIAPDAQRIDGAFIPDPNSQALRHPRDLLDSLSTQPCIFEVFHQAPGPADLGECVRKLLNVHHVLGKNDPPPPLPHLWVLSAGRPASALDALRAAPMPGALRGLYAAPPLFPMGIVVLSELPETRETLLLRLMGAGRTLKQAVSELKGLPAEAREVQVALRILLECRIEVSEDPAQRTPEDEDFIMNTQDIVDAIERRAEERGVERGLRKGLKPLARLFERRLGRPLSADELEVLARRLDTADVALDLAPDALAAWLASKDAE